MEQFETLHTRKTAGTYVKRVVSAPQKVQEGSYLYVGSDFQYTNDLMKDFNSSSYFEDFKSALKVLPKLSESNSLPELIMFDGTKSVPEIDFFLKELKTLPELTGIPVIAEVRECDPVQVKFLLKHPGVDDLISVGEAAGNLRRKAGFLRKMKNPEGNMKEKISTRKPKEINLNYVFKRSLDIAVSGSLLLIFSPVLMLIALAIRLESRGPIFYVSSRAGRGYKVFNFYKFRTMVADADRKVADLMHLNQYSTSTGAPVFFKISNDPRITKIGSFLRNTSLDELPQLINVFMGDMSLVGNRPLPLYEAASLTSDDYAARFLAPAGITGLWQIKKRGDSNMSVEDRINLDIDYASRHNFMYDLWIIANTPSALLQKENV